MNPYAKILDWSKRAGITVGLISSKLVSNYLLSQEVFLAVDIAVFVLVFLVISRLLFEIFQFLFFRSFWLRSFLIGKEFVEGVWVEIVESSNGYMGVGISRLTFTDGKLVFTGDDFSENGALDSNYRGDIIEFDYPCFNYKHTNQRLKNTVDALREGHGEIQFRPQFRDRPSTYSGFFVLHNENIRYSVDAKRVDDKELLKAFDDPMKVGSFVRQYISDYKAGLKPDVKLQVDEVPLISTSSEKSDA